MKRSIYFFHLVTSKPRCGGLRGFERRGLPAKMANHVSTRCYKNLADWLHVSAKFDFVLLGPIASPNP